MTISEYIAKLEKQLALMQSTEGPLFLAASSTHSEQVKRIFEDGKAADGSDIGQYNSTKPLYVDPKKAPVQFATKGKTGKDEFNDGTPHKTGYFESYKAFRANQRRPVDKVNLELFGRLKSDYSKPPHKGDDNSFVTSVDGPENIKKAIGNQRRFQKVIFSLSKEEREKFVEISRMEFKRLIENA